MQWPSATSMTWNDRGFDFAGTIEHASQDLLQAREWGFPRNIIRALDLLFANKGKCPAHHIWRMVKSGFQRNFRIVQTVSIKLDFSSSSASTKEIYGATLTNHIYCP